MERVFSVIEKISNSEEKKASSEIMKFKELIIVFFPSLCFHQTHAEANRYWCGANIPYSNWQPFSFSLLFCQHSTPSLTGSLFVPWNPFCSRFVWHSIHLKFYHLIELPRVLRQWEEGVCVCVCVCVNMFRACIVYIICTWHLFLACSHVNWFNSIQQRLL